MVGLPTRYRALFTLVNLTARYMASRARVVRDGATNTITVFPPDGLHSASVIFMHGLGDSAEGFADVAEMLAEKMPHVKFVLPTAPTNPVSLNGGMRMNSWYDIVGLTDRASETCDGLEESVEIVKVLLQKENEGGIPYHRMALAGFSQGGAMSLTVGYQLPAEKKLAGLVVLSGYLPAAQRFRLTDGLQDLPVFHGHGAADPMVRFQWAEATKSEIEKQGASRYTLKSYAGLPHSVSPQELSDVSDFLSRILPHDASFAIPAKAPEEMTVKELKSAIQAAGLSSQAAVLYEKAEFVKLLQEHRAKNA